MRDFSKQIVARARVMIEPYTGRITLRQLFYMLVSEHLLSNRNKDYRKLIAIMTHARRGEYPEEYRLPINCLADNTRPITQRPYWEDPEDFIDTVKASYRTDWWDSQERHVAVWVEKDALSSLFQPICREWGIPLVVGRGFASIPLMWRAKVTLDEKTLVFYFGDHDPSGLNIQDVLGPWVPLEFERVAVTYEQAETRPFIPVNMGDPRAPAYVEEFGDRRWELEVLSPKELEDLLNEAIRSHCDEAELKRRQEEDADIRDRMEVTY